MTARLSAILVAILLTLVAHGAGAATAPGERLADPVLEERARVLSKELRCLVCQNQSIDDSDAELARDLRRLVRERLVAGDSDAAVKEFLVQRYGDFVLLKPPVTPATWFLWAGPAIVLAAGIAVVALAARRRRPTAPAPLTPSERAELDTLLADEARR